MDEAAQKLHGGQRHRAPLIALGVVLPVKGDVVAIEGEQSVIADRDPMGVAPEIAQDGRRAPEGRLRVDHPIGREERVDEGVPLRRVAEVLAATGEFELMVVVRAAERLELHQAESAATSATTVFTASLRSSSR